MKNELDLTPTPSQTAGPFFHLGCTVAHSVSRIAGPNAKGERIRLICRVLDGEGHIVDDAMIEIWQADSEGKYHTTVSQRSDEKNLERFGFGRLATDAAGICIFETIKPGRVPDGNNKLQTPHLNVSLFARGVTKRLATRIYFAGDPANEECPVLALVPEQRRVTLLAHPDPHHPGDWRFDLNLCGKDETVFFDV